MSLIYGTEQFHEGINLVIRDDLGDELDLCMGVIAVVGRIDYFSDLKSKVLDVLRLGDPIAIGVGVQIEKERRLLLLISVALAGVCVSLGGGITFFLGLIAPHIARRLVGVRHAKPRFLIAVICQYIRKSNHGTDGIAGGDYLFDRLFS
ncbi:iron chelate uptake ABC transporter family permease subunit [Peribacillus frigoritolerans]|uniref:iron chelate uptake ABC transporter family permease subunit n=1 Tax=Peribacillus frigoritolerans TaxID=450367 RepID=UPI00351351C9